MKYLTVHEDRTPDDPIFTFSDELIANGVQVILYGCLKPTGGPSTFSVSIIKEGMDEIVLDNFANVLDALSAADAKLQEILG